MSLRQTSTRSPPQTLDSLANSDSQSRYPGLRGQHHARIPKISSQPFNTLLPGTKDRIAHTAPYYISQEHQVEFNGTVPWLQISNAAMLNHWTSSETFQRNYFDAFASDLIYSEISSICSVFLIVSRTTGEKDKKLVSWFHRKLLRPVIIDLIESCCYNYIWKLANTITDSQIKSLQRVYDYPKQDGAFLHFLQDHRRATPNIEQGSKLYPYRVGQVVFCLNQIQKNASLQDNYAMRRLKEMLLSQVAMGTLFNTARGYLEKEMNDIDIKERIKHPPRKLPHRYRATQRKII